MSTVESIFSARLQQARADSGMSRELLAHKAGLTSATIYRWEQGKTDPPFRFVILLAEALEVSIDYLAGRDGKATT